MEHLDSEKEQLEKIKHWLQENGLSIVLGIVLGLGGVYGWRGWQSYQAGVAEEYSARITSIENHLSADRLDQAVTQAQKLIAEAGNELYVNMSRLLLARAYVDQGELDKAAEPLANIVADKDSPLKTIAALRLARIYLSQAKLDAASQLIPSTTDGAYAQAFAELKGDIAQARGQHDAARSAYEQAIALANNDPSNQFLQMKLEAVPVTE
jgi:predicted negative regulator of RcsB-dependent stress response